MSGSVLGDELTFILGPPTDGELRGAFDDYQSAVSEGREQDVQRYEALQREYLQEVFVGQDGDSVSPFAEVLGAALGVPLRVRRVGIDRTLMRGVWVVAVTVRRADLEFGAGASAIPFPPGRPICEELAASLGLLLNRDWCAWVAPKGDC